MNTALEQAELIRYSRHILLDNVGIEGQKKLKNAKVLCVGAGGLASSLLTYLAAAGVGTIGIIDNDVVEISNLQRQILYSSSDVGHKKIHAAKSRLQSINPHIKLEIFDEKLSDKNAIKIISDYDIVADSTDNFSSRYIISDACYFLKKMHAYAGIYQFDGYCSLFDAGNGGPCYRCLFKKPPPKDLIPNCAEAGVIGVLPGIMGCFQAAEIIKYILKIGAPLIEILLKFNSLSMEFNKLPAKKDPRCELCSNKEISFGDLSFHDETASCAAHDKSYNEISPQELFEVLSNANEDLMLIDVREPFEFEICNLGGSLIPLKSLSDRLMSINKTKKIILYCKGGDRSKKGIDILKSVGFNNVYSLKGGILSWIKNIDNNLTAY